MTSKKTGPVVVRLDRKTFDPIFSRIRSRYKYLKSKQSVVEYLLHEEDKKLKEDI